MADFALELSFDAASAEAIEAQWRALQDAGLPSQADHARGMVNAPHVSLVVASDIEDSVRDAAAIDIAPLLPTQIHVRGLVVLGQGSRVTLAHLVEPSFELAAGVARLRAATPAVRHSVWTPHVTLARRVARADVGAAIQVLGASPQTLVADRLRWWNPNTGHIATIASA